MPFGSELPYAVLNLLVAPDVSAWAIRLFTLIPLGVALLDFVKSVLRTSRPDVSVRFDFAKSVLRHLAEKYRVIGPSNASGVQTMRFSLQYYCTVLYAASNVSCTCLHQRILHVFAPTHLALVLDGF